MAGLLGFRGLLSLWGLREGDVHHGGKNRLMVDTALFMWKSGWAGSQVGEHLWVLKER